MISVRSEVQILPGPPPVFAEQNTGTRQRLRSNRESAAFRRSRDRGPRQPGWRGGRGAHVAEARIRAPAAALALKSLGWLWRLLAQPRPPRSDFGLRPKPRGCSSVGRAPALQAGGRRFESDHLHHRPNDARRRSCRGRVSGCESNRESGGGAGWCSRTCRGARQGLSRRVRKRATSIGNDEFAWGLWSLRV